MMTTSRMRLVAGFLILAGGVLCNEWVLASLFSPDGHLEVKTRIMIWISDLSFVALGLVLLFAGRQTILNLCLAASITLVLLIALDTATRPLLRDKLYFLPDPAFLKRLPALPSLTRYESNVRYSMTGFGGLAAIYGRTEYRQYRKVTCITDAYGFKNESYDPSMPIDLIMLGDSFGAGAACRQEKAWCSLLSSRYGLRTYNLSISGHNPWMEWMDLKRELPRLNVRPGTVVLWALYAGNDMRNPEGHDPGVLRPNDGIGRIKVRISSYAHRSPVLKVLGRILDLLDPKYIRRRQAVDNAIVPKNFLGRGTYLYMREEERGSRMTREQVLKHRDYPVYKSVFESMRLLTEKNKLDVFVVIIPTRDEVYGWFVNDAAPWSSSRLPSGFSEVTQDLCRQNGFRYLDLKPCMVEISETVFRQSGDLLYWLDDSHWNELGHAEAARITYDRLFGNSSSNATEHPGKRPASPLRPAA